jgi:hypothetical protein
LKIPIPTLVVNNRPLLTAETQEQISICEWEVHNTYSEALLIFAAASTPLPPGFMMWPTPDMPPQPLMLFGIVKRYAIALFACEDSRYPQTEELPSWRDALAIRTEKSVEEGIRRFEKSSRSLRFHASLDEMTAAVRVGLAEHVDKLAKPIDPLPLPDRRAVVDSHIETALRQTGKRMTRTDIWKLVGYKTGAEFEQWQRRDPKTSKAAERNFNRFFAKPQILP